MITYTFKIDTHDGKGLRVIPISPLQGNSDIRVLGEELDSGFMTLWLKNDKSLPIMSYIEYTISDENASITRKFYLGRDDTNRLSKNKNYYEHNLELIELTKKLEKHLEGTICFTQPTEIGKTNYTLRTCIERILRIFPLGIDKLNNNYKDTSENIDVYPFHNNTIVNEIDVDLASFLSNIQAPQFVFTNPTLREAIDGVLKYVNAVTKLDTYYNIPNVTKVYSKIGAEFYGYLRNLVNVDNIYSYNISQNIEDYASRSKSNANNINLENFYDNGQFIQYPSSYKLNTTSAPTLTLPTRVERVKSNDSEYSINDSNVGILTQFPIKSIVSLQIPIKITEVLRYVEATHNVVDFKTHFNIESDEILIDVAAHIVEQSVYENLTEEEKIDYFYYQLNSNFINCSPTYKRVFFTASAQSKVLYLSLVDFLNKYANRSESVYSTKYEFKFRLIDQNSNEGTREFSFSLQPLGANEYVYLNGEILTTNNFHKDARYRISYISQTNSIVSIENENLYDVNINTQSNVNQEDRVISFSNFTNTLYSLSQRTGTRDLEVTCKHFNVSDLIDIGDYTLDNYVCTKAEYIYYNNFIIGKYLFDRNYNRISSYIGVNADIRQYEIPTGRDTYERQCEIDTYIEISKENNLDENILQELAFELKYPLVSSLGAFNGKIGNDGTKVDSYNFNSVKQSVISYTNEFTYNSEINDYLKELSGYEYPCLMLECFGKGEKNLLSFDFGFKDNINAGEFVKSSVEGILEDIKLIKQKVPYCMYYGDKIGFLRNLNFNLITNDYNYMNLNEKLPIVSFSGKGLVNIDNLMVLKDPSEILKFTYKMNFISIDEGITLGRWFINHNYIFQDKTESVGNSNNEKFSLYYSNKKYSKWDIDKISNTIQPQLEWDNFSEVSPLTYNNVQDDKVDFYIQFNKDVMPTIPNDTKTIIIANGKDIVMTIAYDPLNLDENEENEIYKPIYFNFRTKRSKIVYEY